ncbi:toll/interleukin-1 receptor domain-containing adapter protein-like [Acipenser ruthenus]|uniref:toll/interleukin-1 receptor domain-containing adapter protein-like n=1 Tax=Acipenser ruthenus TaxID=7906 RepID=UPI0027426A8B|nr:toll/interleukin-1 receptor domain-containing adapter protein-like [Acipenser ruthenus]XP_058865625.1 toll/interleukin-1 receptor domain-containing adapter protein-like [Acipenser ruthenus]
MAGWIRRLLERRKRDSFSKTTNPSSSQGTASSHSASSSSSRSRRPDLSSGARWSRLYDLCVCHSEEDISEAQLLVSYLESQPEGLRCFLMLRDSNPGGSIPSELCQAVQSSHCWALLITRSFLLDPWCKYQMHQALVEAPMANGRTIPVLHRLQRSEYPKELRFYYYIDITADQQRGFQQVHRTVLHYLEELCQVDSSKLSSPSSVDTETGVSEEGHRTTHSELSSTDSG